MARSSILSDELVRQLVAVGPVDLMVGLPTFQNAATAQDVVQAIHAGLARHFPRERTVLINPDAGSEDGTRERVLRAPLAVEERQHSTSLRTTHRVSALHRGAPDSAAGIRIVFAAADLLQARVVVLLDPATREPDPEAVADLARPVWQDRADFVLPLRPRRPFDGPLSSQLVHPLFGAAFTRRVHPGLTAEFACSGRFAARMVGHAMWSREPGAAACEVWMLATALAEDVRLAQVHWDATSVEPRSVPGGLPALFQQVVGSLFASLEEYSGVWRSRTGLEEVPTFGTPRPPSCEPVHVETAPMFDRFRAGVRELMPLLREILTPEIRSRVQTLAETTTGPLHIDDELWVNVVYDFAAASPRSRMPREHLTQALVPLYLGRTGSFLDEMSSGGESGHPDRLQALEREYARLRPSFVEHWQTMSGR